MSYDAIIVPGGGVREGSKLPIWVKRRLDRALEIQKSEYIITLSAGTTFKPPPLKTDGYPIFESIAAAQYLIEQGASADTILSETCSYDTIGNAYFAKTIHIDPLDLTKLLIITSSFHMERTRRIFKWIYNLEGTSKSYRLFFEEVSDEGIPRIIMRARIKKEARSIKRLKLTIKNIKTIKQFHEWLFTQHDAYIASERNQKNIGSDLLKSY